MKTKIILQATTFAAVLGLAAAAHAQYAIPHDTTIFSPALPASSAIDLTVPGTLGSGYSDVTATFDGYNASDTDILQYSSGTTANGNTIASGTDIFNNKTTAVGATFDLGDFANGTEVIFDVAVGGSTPTWYSGSDSSLNSDGKDHFDVAPAGSTVSVTDGGHNYAYTAPALGANSVIVGVEDATDFDYNDLIYGFSGIEQTVPSVPDVAGTMSLLGLGLTGLTVLGRRFRR